MSKLHFSLLCCIFTLTALQSQEISLKYGKITADELNMRVYPKDTSAVAAVLYDNGYSAYEYTTTDGFKIWSEIYKKIKIFKQEGESQATITIPYYYKLASNRETFSNIEAISYNMENGKIVKTKLDKKYIFDEEVSKFMHQIKFSIPNVKVGSVIEFKYKRTSPNYYNLPDWQMQSDIPVLNSTYEVLIPEYFDFNTEIKGYENIKTVESDDTQQFNLGVKNDGSPNSVLSSSKNIKFTAVDIPALKKDESNVWCVEDFMSGIRFELKGTRFPNTFYKPYSQSWEDVEKYINDVSDLGTNLKMSDPYKKEIKKLTDSITDEKTKIELIYSFIKHHIRWNEKYSFFGNKAHEAVKNGTGDNGQINLVLLSALKDAGIKAYPILISRRSEGRLPFSFPSYDKLSTFLIAAVTADGKQHFYMDGSAVYGGLNMLPTNLLVDRGRIFDPTVTEKWVDLTNIAKNQHISFMLAQLDRNGVLSGKQTTIFTNQLAYAFKLSYFGSKDSLDFVDKLKTANQITVDSLKITGKETMSSSVNEVLDFTKKYDTDGDFIYINPLIFPHMIKNDFIQSERKLPVEFNYPYIYQISCTILLPENYKVEEIPKSIKMTLNNAQGKCIYQVQQDGNNLQVSYRFELNQTIFPQTDYAAIREFFGQVVTKNTEMIVLKKI